MANRIMLKNVTLSYPHLFEPFGMEGQEPKYSAALLIDKSDKKNIAKIEKAFEDAVAAGKAKNPQAFAKKNLWNPLRDGDEKDSAGYAGHVYLNAKSNKRPQVVDQNVNPILDRDQIYAGCVVNATVSLFPFATNGNAGVGVGLGNIQLVRDGERLDGGASAESEFSVLDDDDDDDIFG